MTTAQDRLKALSGHYFANNAYHRSTSSVLRDVINPATDAVEAHYAEMEIAEVDAVIAQAKAAQKEWWALAATERATLMHAVAEKMMGMEHLLAETMTREMGKPYKESKNEVAWTATSLRFSAEVGRNDNGRVMGPSVPGQMHYSIKLPYGVAGIILPFNYPLSLFGWEVGAALAAGNAVVVKPSEYTTFTTMILAEAFDLLPKGLLQIVSGGGAVGARLVEHPDVGVVAFTGSVPVARSVSATCGDLMKPCLIEASGNDPFIVMPSAPLDVTARAATFAAFMNCGQICTSSERFYVHEDIHDDFVAKMIEETKKIRVGNGLDKVEMGPMVSAKERTRYEAVIAKAIEEGATVALGGGRPKGLEDTGNFVEPTILTNCTPEMSVYHNESFGPVAPICKVKSFDEALALANASDFGLGAVIYTTDLNETMRASAELQGGMVWINAPLIDNDAGPFGGTKLSGTGRQLGSEGIDTFRQTKTVMIDGACNPQDFWWFPYAEAEMYPGDDA